MDDIDVKNVKKGKKFFLLFVVIGIILFIVFGIIGVAGQVKYKSLDYQVEATKIEENPHYNSDDEIMYSPIYHYEVNGTAYTCKSTISSNTPPSDSQRIVYYDSKNPSKCMTSYSKSGNSFVLIFTILPIIMIVIGIVNMLKINKRIKQINALNSNGKLAKNLPYYLEDTGMAVNDVKIKRPVVDYILPSGEKVKLKGDPRHDRKLIDTDGMVDLVIDESNPSNYFIDFEINRLSGNQSTDYYNQPIQYALNNNMFQSSTTINNMGQSFTPTNIDMSSVPVQPNQNIQTVQNNIPNQQLNNVQSVQNNQTQNQ